MKNATISYPTGRKLPVGMRIPCGSKPELTKIRPDGVRVLRKAQKSAFLTLKNADLRQLIAPTGSGKSVSVMALGLNDLKTGRATKIVVAVPQHLIAGAFEGRCKIQLPTGATVVWAAEHRLIGLDGVTDVVAKIHKFLTTPLTDRLHKVNPERILLCSHAALVAYHKANPSSDAYPGVSFIIDEAHHSKYGEEDDLDEDEKKKIQVRNQLGVFVKAWLSWKLKTKRKTKLGTLTLTSATWFRTDRIAIVPEEFEKRFERYTLSAADYLASHQHLREIEIRFLRGLPEDAVEQIHGEDPSANTLIYLQPVSKARDKFDEMKALMKALGLHSGDVVDLVNPEGRTLRQRKLLESIRNGEWDLGRPRAKNYVFALNLGREGFDMPALQRSVVLGPRGSMQVVVQMLGRLLRDHPNKKKVQFNIVLPFEESDLTDGALIASYTKTMLGALALGSILWPPSFENDTDRETFRRLTANGPGAATALMVGVGDRLSDSKVKHAVAFVDDLIERGELTLPDGIDDKKSLSRVLVAILQRQAQSQILDQMDDPTMIQDDFAGLRTWRLAFGHNSLTDLYRSIGKQVQFSPDEVEDIIRGWNKSKLVAGPKAKTAKAKKKKK